MQTKPKLDILFKAIFEDGTAIEQTAADVSPTDPTRSAFYDVMLRLNEIALFALFKDGKQVACADLRSGLFDVGGTVFSAHPQHFIPTTPLELVYFRDTRVDSTVESTMSDGPKFLRRWSQPKEVSRKHFVAAYYIGWHAKDNKGHDTKVTIGILP
jgi:hypothetical protein